MPSNIFLNDTTAAGRPMKLFDFSDGVINNLASFHNASGIFLTVRRYLTFISHTYERNSRKLYVCLFLDGF